MGNCCNKVTETTCDHSDYETQSTRHELVLTNEGQTPLIITLKNESSTEIPDESPSESPKDSATELQSASESEPSWMPPVSLPVPNFPKEEPSSETETPDVSPKDSATKFQSASESEPFLMPPVSQPVPNFPITDPTTKLQSKLPNKRSQRAPSSEPSKSSVRKEHGHRRTSPPKQPKGQGKKKPTTKTPAQIDGPIEEPGKKKPTTKTPAQIEPHEEGYASDTTITNMPLSSEFGMKSSEKSSLSHEENSQISGTATELQSRSESEPSRMSLVSNSVSNFPTEEPTTDLTTASGASEATSSISKRSGYYPKQEWTSAELSDYEPSRSHSGSYEPSTTGTGANTNSDYRRGSAYGATSLESPITSGSYDPSGSSTLVPSEPSTSSYYRRGASAYGATSLESTIASGSYSESHDPSESTEPYSYTTSEVPSASSLQSTITSSQPASSEYATTNSGSTQKTTTDS